MTGAEMDAWVVEHQSKLLAVAKKRASKARAHNVELDAEDILQTALAAICRRLDTIPDPHGLWTYAVKAIRSKANDAQAAEVARFKYQQAAANDDPSPATLRARELNSLPRNAKGQIDPSARSISMSTVLAPKWEGPMPGNARWRFQTLRDDRLFAARVLRSHHDSMLAAVKRQVFGLERGNSYTEFGLEMVG